MSRPCFDGLERAALCDLLEWLGPDAPTVLAPWTTRDIAVHLYLREHDPVAEGDEKRRRRREALTPHEAMRDSLLARFASLVAHRSRNNGAVDPALAGVLGAAIGAAAGLGGSAITTVSSGRQVRRQERASSYAAALNHLTRAAARRSTIMATGEVLLAKEDLPQWFLDLADAEHSLAVAAGNSGRAVREPMVGALKDLTDIVQEITKGPVKISSKGSTVIDRLWAVQGAVAKCAIDDLGGT